MGCCFIENREKEIIVEIEQKQNILVNKSNEEIEIKEVKTYENIVNG